MASDNAQAPSGNPDAQGGSSNGSAVDVFALSDAELEALDIDSLPAEDDESSQDVGSTDDSTTEREAPDGNDDVASGTAEQHTETEDEADSDGALDDDGGSDPAAAPRTSHDADQNGNENTHQDSPHAATQQNPLGGSEGESSGKPASSDKNAASKQPAGAQSADQPGKQSVDYESAYKQLLAPLKASGATLDVRSVDEARELMSKGVHFTKKMTQLKPGLKTLKLLEEAGVRDEAALGHLLDLHRRDPAAIAKLVADAKIDPMDIDTEQGASYAPKMRTVSDVELDLDAAIDAIVDTPTYSRTITVIGRDWDDASKQAIGAEPALVGIINDHVANGIFDAITTEITRQRTYGKLAGVSDLDAYQRIGEELDAQGALAGLTGADNRTGSDGSDSGGSAPDKTRTSPNGTQALPGQPGSSSAQSNDARERRRRAAGAAPSQTNKAAGADQANPLAMSDEEFMKKYGNELPF